MEAIRRIHGSRIDEIRKGYSFDGEADGYTCLVCGKFFEKGEIFEKGGRYFEAEKFAALHVKDAHGGMFEWLLSLGKKYTGLTDHQRELLRLFASGLADREIAAKLGGISGSTVRNHRFSLREHERQATVFVAIMQLLSELESAGGDPREFIEAPLPAAVADDDRYAITREEMSSIVEKYFPEGPEGPAKEFPKKEKRRLAVLIHISSRFESGRNYTEQEVNGILKSVHARDFVTIRRALVDYGFLGRRDDGSVYWLNS